MSGPKRSGGTHEGRFPDAPADAPRDAIPGLSAAVLRIGASLDLQTVLQEVADSARALTGARCGVIAAVDASGAVEEFATSGLTPAEQRELIVSPDGLRFFAHLRDLPAPVRLEDLEAYVRGLGYAANLLGCTTFQGTPMRHQGAHVGNFFLADKAQGGFTAADEEVLVLFAAHAAAAIANARAHRDERRARADLEALVETSPVAVVVFDAPSGRPKTINREARRLLDGLRLPGRSVDESLEALTCRLVDGREYAFADFPREATLGRAERLRAEEIELSVPDGRRVAALVNATPIRSAAGAVASVVVTAQDLAPLEELERVRAEFLAMVSHELRVPLAAVKGSATTVLAASPELDAAETREFVRVIDQQADHMRDLVADLLDAGRIDAGTLSVAPAPVAVADLVERARSAFLGAADGIRHAVRVDLPGGLPRVLADPRRIVQVLNNLLANAVRHAPAPAPIQVGAESDGAEVAIWVADEGPGLAPEALRRLFRRHSGASGGHPRPAGFGLGLAICKGLVEAHGGRIRAESGAGRGTRVTFTLPAAEESVPGPGPGGARPDGGADDAAPILVVDDDPRALRHAREALADAGYEAVLTGDPQAVPDLIREKRPRLVLLDLLLPGTDGIELMETLPELDGLPVVFISAYGRDETVARALERGAADYIVKPFSPTELIARVRAALRGRTPESFALGGLAIHYARREVSVRGQPVALTAKEFDVLRLLSLNGERVTTFATLRAEVWADSEARDPEPIRTIVKKLRRKLGDDAADPAWVVNVRGVGYRMAGPGGDAP